MGKFFRRFLGESVYQAIGGVIGWLLGLPVVAGLVAAVTAYLGDLSWLTIYLATLGAFALGCVVAVCVIWLIDRLSVFRRLSLVDIRLKHAVLNGTMIDNLTIHGTLANTGKARIYASHKRVICTLQNKTGPQLQVSTIPILVDSYSKESFVFEPISGVDLKKEARGIIDVEILYGRSEGSPKYIYECRCELALLIKQTGAQEYDLTIANAVRHEAHRKA
jgi:hypothetical protein